MQPITPSRRRTARIAAGLLVIDLIAMFVLTHVPTLPKAARQFHDKWAHFTAFFVLTTLYCIATPGRRPWLRYGSAVVLAAGYAIFDEWTQGWVAGRHRDPWDFLADLAGTFSAIVVYVLFRYQFAKNRPVGTDRSAQPSGGPSE